MSGSRLRVRTPEGELSLELPLPGLYNVYNALAAITAGLASGVSLETIRAGLESMRARVRARRDDRGGRASRSRSC